MADKAISDLTQALQITNEDLFVLEQNGEAKKLKGSQVVQYAKDSVAAEVQGVKEYADNAKASADAAAKDATRAENAAQGIDDKVAVADASAKAAASSAAAAAASATGVDEKVQAAQTAATNAAKSETAAKDAQTAAANFQSAAEMAKTGAQSAKTAAESAQEAAESAKDAAAGSVTTAGQKAAQASQSAEDAASAKSAAETAKTDAQAARDAIVNMIVEAVTLASGSDATVSKSVVDNVFKLAFGIPQGNPGADAPTITGITIRQSDYHMIVSLSDGATYDAGYCRGAAGAGSGDMLASVYDPQGKYQDIFAYADEALAGKLDKPANDASATTGQVLTKTAGGQTWSDREKDVLIVTLTGDGSDDDPFVSSPTPDEILAAAQAGKMVELHYANMAYSLFNYYTNTEESFLQFSVTRGSSTGIVMEILFAHKSGPTGAWDWDADSVSTTQYLPYDGNGSEVTAAFAPPDATSERANLISGEKLSVLFGKIAKWFADLGSLAFKDTVTTNDVSATIKASLSRADSAVNVSATAADNGKFLRVVNGAWAAATVDNANGVSF